MNKLLFLFALPLFALAACSGGSGAAGDGGAETATGGTGYLSIEITDAPIDYEMVEAAVIWVDTIRVHGSDGGWRTIYDDVPVELDLLELRNGLKRSLVLAELPVGSYGQMRLVLSRAYLRLTNGNEYDSDDGSIHFTSQDTSGFKVFIEPEVEVVTELTSSLLLDVDLTKTFKPVPGNDPLNANRYHLHPVIRVANLGTSGDIRGLVRRDDGSGNLIGVGAATVYILPPGGVPEDAIATTATEVDGAYAVLGLEEGTYDVYARRSDFSGRMNGQMVSQGNATLVDITVSQ